MRRLALAPWLALAVALVGCGASPSPESRSADQAGRQDTSDTEESTDQDAERSPDETSEPPPDCPPSFDAPGPDCTGGRSLQCGYPEGQCYCGAERRCSGVPPRYDEPPTWVCIPTPPPCPEVGTPCEAGQVGCSPWCCGVAIQCVNGVWSQVLLPCPPSAPPRDPGPPPTPPQGAVSADPPASSQPA